MNITRYENGRFPSYAWPGGYPIVYGTEDGGTLCPDSANGDNGSEAHEASTDPQWRLIHGQVYWEGPDLCCDHCYGNIPSAYGDPEGGDA